MMYDGCIADYYDPDHSIRSPWPEEMPYAMRDDGRMALERDEAARLGQPWLRASEVEGFLRQTKLWRNIENREIPLRDIDTRYAGNIVRFLERKASELLLIAGESRFYAEVATDFITGDADRFQAQDAVAWMRKQPLYKAIQKRAA